jgi:hypothetical protein
MPDVLSLLVSMSLQILLPFWLIRRDERKLTQPALNRAFPEATFWIAVVVLGLVSIPIHFVRTRRSVTGLLLGLLWFCAGTAIIIAAGEGLAFILE